MQNKKMAYWSMMQNMNGIDKRGVAVHALALLLLFLPLIAFAQGLVPCDGDDCTFDSLLQLVRNIINWIIAIAMPVAAVLFAYAGYLYITDGGSGRNISKAKSIFQNVAIGFAFVLLAWLIVYTVVTVLLDDASLLKRFFDTT